MVGSFTLTNLNVSSNSNVSFSLIKSDQLISFCKANKIKEVSVCDYYQYDFVNFYFLCKKNRISPIWGIKKILVYRKKNFFVSFFPTSYANYKIFNNFFYAKKIDRLVDFETILKNPQIFLVKCLFVFETRSFFDFEEACKIKDIVSKVKDENDDQFSLKSFYIGINFIPKKEKIKRFFAFENNSFLLPFYSVNFLSKNDKDYLVKFRSIDRKDLGEFSNEEINQNYFHYLNYTELEEILIDSSFARLLFLNLKGFISRIKITIRTQREKLDDSSFLELKEFCTTRLISLNLASDNNKKYKALLDEELKVIKKKNYSSYFNKLRIITKELRESGIEIGPGRGSSVSSLVSYLSGITRIDPVKNELYFWRFLNEKRADLPDIDVDVNNQEMSFKKLTDIFGREFVSKISTRKSIGLINLVKNSLDFFNLQQEEKNVILDNLEEFSKTFKGEIFSFKALKMKAIFDRNSFFFKFLRKFHDLFVGISSHPAGIIIWEKKIPKVLPIRSDSENLLICSYPSNSLEKLGFKKFDFLSLTESLNFISYMKKKFPQICSYEEISFKDYKTWDLLKNSMVSFIFQIDSKISRQSLLKILPSSLNELVLAISLNRPGVRSSSASIIDNKKKKIYSETSSKSINEILSSTYGNIMFEEQLTIIISFCMSLELDESEIIRKKLKENFNKKEFFDEFRESFFLKSSEKLNLQDQKLVFKKISESLTYMFNKSHAISYSYLTYYMSYIKANYFEQSMIYFLEKSNSNSEKNFLLFSEIFLQGYEVIKPEINSSHYENFFIGNKLIMGFSSLAGVDKSLFLRIIENREKFGKYTSLRDFIDRNIVIFFDYNIEKILPWIETGLLRSLDYDSSTIIDNFEFLSRYVEIRKVIKFDKEVAFFDKEYSFQKKIPEEINKKELCSFNCYVSYFDRWRKISNQNSEKISLLQDALKDNSDQFKIVRIYSIFVGSRKVKNFFLFLIYDLNQVFEIFVNQNDFVRYREVVKNNKEFIFEVKINNNKIFDSSVQLVDVIEV